MSGNDADDLDGTAAEYVVGTLDAAERAAFALRLAGDEGARLCVLAWEKRLAPLARALEPMQPPDSLWSRIEVAIDASTAGVITPRRRAEVVDLAPSAALRRSRDRWRMGAAALASLVAVLLIFVAVHDGPRFGRNDPDPIFVAAVNRGGTEPALIVRVDMRTRQVLVRPVAASAPQGHSLELWYIGTGGAPRSLGLVSGEVEHRSIPEGARADDPATLAVSIEPPGGSPTGGPTGAVIYSGKLVRE